MVGRVATALPPVARRPVAADGALLVSNARADAVPGAEAGSGPAHERKTFSP